MHVKVVENILPMEYVFEGRTATGAHAISSAKLLEHAASTSTDEDGNDESLNSMGLEDDHRMSPEYSPGLYYD
jgi:hypothetical protein